MSEQPVALVTGAATGIGAACARQLSAEGFRVGIHYRSSAEKAEKLLAELPGAFGIQADLTVSEDQVMLDAIYSAFLAGEGDRE